MNPPAPKGQDHRRERPTKRARGPVGARAPPSQDLAGPQRSPVQSPAVRRLGPRQGARLGLHVGGGRCGRRRLDSVRPLRTGARRPKPVPPGEARRLPPSAARGQGARRARWPRRPGATHHSSGTSTRALARAPWARRRSFGASPPAAAVRTSGCLKATRPGLIARCPACSTLSGPSRVTTEPSTAWPDFPGRRAVLTPRTPPPSRARVRENSELSFRRRPRLLRQAQGSGKGRAGRLGPLVSGHQHL